MALTTYTYTLYVNYNANGGTGAPSRQTFSTESFASSVTVSGTLSYTTPTRSGYTFSGWWLNGNRFDPGGAISATFTKTTSNQSKTVTLSAGWTQSGSTWGTTPSSVNLNGVTAYEFNINKASGVDHHTLRFDLGSSHFSYTNVGTSEDITFPVEWQEELQNSTQGTITCTLKSYNASGTKVGSDVTKTITGKVPASVVPTVSVVAEQVNDDATVAEWGILLKGYSKIKFTVTASGRNGSTISTIKYYGAGINKTVAATTATSSVLNETGLKVWTITATDSRGRTAEATYSEQIYPYSTPSISAVSAFRCDSNGKVNEASGTYALFNGRYTYSDANSHNALTQVVESKPHNGNTWTTQLSSYTSNTDVTIGSGLFDTDKTYDIRLTITDSLGNSATYSVFLASVQGFAIGLKNDRARFGGVPVRAGLQIDWDIFLGDKQIMKSLWTGSWDTGNITVDGISQYKMCIVRMSGQGTLMLAFIYDNGSTVFFRGEGGYAVSASAETRYYISATLSGDTLTMDDCHSINASGTRTSRTVNEIIGVI